MGTSTSDQGKQKFTDRDVLRCFNEENRRSVGKIELSSKEITEILNQRVLDGEEVTRQAVKNRLDEMVGDELVRNQHGRSHLYSRSNDLERLFRDIKFKNEVSTKYTPVQVRHMSKGRNPEVDDDDIVATLRDWPQEGVYPSTSTVRDALKEEYGADYDRKTVYRRLDSLESEGRINKIEVGQGRGKSVGWYVDTTQDLPTQSKWRFW